MLAQLFETVMARRNTAWGSGRHRTPVTAIVVTSALSVIVRLYAAAWFVVTSISTICLYLAYIPVVLNLRNRLRDSGERMSPVVAGMAARPLVIAHQRRRCGLDRIITVVFMLPPNGLVLWTMLAVSVALTAVWALFARRHFDGPANVAH